MTTHPKARVVVKPCDEEVDCRHVRTWGVELRTGRGDDMTFRELSTGFRTRREAYAERSRIAPDPSPWLEPQREGSDGECPLHNVCDCRVGR
jgi:hypothetical protein